MIRNHVRIVPDHELDVLHLASDGGEHVKKIAEPAVWVAALERVVINHPDSVAERAHALPAVVHRVAALAHVVAAAVRLIAQLANLVAILAHRLAALAYRLTVLVQVEATLASEMPNPAFAIAELAMNESDSALEMAGLLIRVTEPARAAITPERS